MPMMMIQTIWMTSVVVSHQPAMASTPTISTSTVNSRPSLKRRFVSEVCSPYFSALAPILPAAAYSGAKSMREMTR